MSSDPNAGAEEQRVVFRIPRDAAGNVVQPDMSLSDILSAGDMYPIQAFVNDMEVPCRRRFQVAYGGDAESVLLAKLPLVCGKILLLDPHAAAAATQFSGEYAA